MKILHIITGLGDGGAEGVLTRLAINSSHLEHIIISLTGEGKYGAHLRRSGIEVHCLNMRRSFNSAFAVWHLFKLVKSIKPDVVQTWMYHSDFLGGIVAKFAGIDNIFWGVRHSNLTPGTVKMSTRLVAYLCAYLSKFVPKKIICCSVEAVKTHTAIGYDANKFITIANGYCLDKYHPYLDTSYLDEELGLRNEILIAMVSRFDPQKDHMNLFSAISKVKSEYPNIKCLLVGEGMSATNKRLHSMINKSGCSGQVVLLGKRNDIPFIMNKIDIHILSSLGEAFPNVIAEAMACGTPCVSTDVGDAALIIGDTGWTAKSQDSNALADALRRALDEITNNNSAWIERKLLARNQIVNKFEMSNMVNSYVQEWKLTQ